MDTTTGLLITAFIAILVLVFIDRRAYRQILVHCATHRTAEFINGKFYYIVTEGEYNEYLSWKLARKHAPTLDQVANPGFMELAANEDIPLVVSAGAWANAMRERGVIVDTGLGPNVVQVGGFHQETKGPDAF